MIERRHPDNSPRRPPSRSRITSSGNGRGCSVPRPPCQGGCPQDRVG
jgi:hypothetical protein